MLCIVSYSEVTRKELLNFYPTEGLDGSEGFSLDGEELFSGTLILASKVNEELMYYRRFYIKGEAEMELIRWSNRDVISSIAFYSCWNSNGYELVYRNKQTINMQMFDMEAVIEFNKRNIFNDNSMYSEWEGFRYSDNSLCYSGDRNVLPYYKLQNEIAESTIKIDSFNSEKIRYIGGVDVGYDELELKIIGAIVVYDLEDKVTVDEKIVEGDMLFNYCNDLFSYREVPILMKEINNLKIKPDLLICSGPGIAHPRHAGLANHLGVKLNIPSIGCSKNRILGDYENLGTELYNQENLICNGEVIGKALRIVINEKPIFVSIGHKISLETAVKWCLKLHKENKNSNIRLPTPLNKTEALVNDNLNKRTYIEFILTED